MSLTRHPEGSLRELIHIAFPLMLSSLSVMSMVFVDRLFLAHYSMDAFNAVANAMTLGWAYIFAWMVLTSIAEVLVAQYNGAGWKERLGEPVWQMIWLSVFSTLFFIPMSLYGSAWFYGAGADRQLEKDYFSWMMLFGPSFALYGALCGFFVGQGKTLLITLVAISANFINAGLDYVLIFGLRDLLPSLGVKGAAIATSGSVVFQVFILFAVFLNSKHRTKHGTGRYFLQTKIFWNCMRIGFPGALFVAIEMLGWASFYHMMTQVSERHITIAGISQSIMILLFFFAEGISKAASVLAGNFLGAQKTAIIKKVVWAGMKLHGLFFIFLLAAFGLFIDQLIINFLPYTASETTLLLKDSLQTCLFYVCFYLFFEGVRLLFAGVLTAIGDTLFLMLAGSLSVWICLVLPTYFLIVQKKGSIETASLICVFYSFFAGLLYLWRLKWKNSQIYPLTTLKLNIT